MARRSSLVILLFPFSVRTVFGDVHRLAHKVVVRRGHVDGPLELLPLCLVVDLLDGDVKLLAPGHGDTGVQVVKLGGAQGNGLVLLLVCGRELQLLQLFLQALHGLLLLLVIHLFLLGTSGLGSLLQLLALPFSFLNLLPLVTDFLLQVCHGLVKALRSSALMVTQYGHCTVGSVVLEDLGRDGSIRVCQELQLLLQGAGSVVCTEHLGRESVHQLVQMLVEDLSLGRKS